MHTVRSPRSGNNDVPLIQIRRYRPLSGFVSAHTIVIPAKALRDTAKVKSRFNGIWFLSSNVMTGQLHKFLDPVRRTPANHSDVYVNS